MTKRSKRIKKVFIWPVIVLFVLMILSVTVMFIKAGPFIKQKLSEWVDNESDHLYRLSVGDIKIKFIPITLIAEDIDLTTNIDEVKKIREESTEKILYKFHSKEIKLAGIFWKQLWDEKIFHCKNLTINEPELELTGEAILESDSIKTFDRLFQAMQPVFKKTLKRVIFDEINIVNANYEIYASPNDVLQVSNAKHVSVTIKNFITDSLLIFNETKLFDSDNIILRLNNLSNILGDSLHTFTIDTLEYSLNTSDISAYGFHLFYNLKVRDKNLFDVFVPKLHLKSKSITRFVLGDSLNIDYLEFDNSTIKFYQKENPKKINIENLNQFNLYSLIQNQFTKIKADSFRLVNANIEIFHQPEFNTYQQNLESVNVLLYGFKLDSTSSEDPNRLFHANEIKMEIDGYHLRLEDDMHEFRADTLFVSTISNSLRARNIRVSPLNNSGEKLRNQVNVQCKKLDIDQVNLKTMYHTRRLPTRSISVVEPVVTLVYQTEIAKQQNHKETGLLFELVQAYLKGVYSDVVVVENGSLRIEHSQNSTVQGYFETGFNFALSGFALDSASAKKTDKFFYATDFDLQFSNYEMKLIDNLHKIHVDNIAILSTDRKLEITNLSLQPVISNVSQDEMEKFNRSELYNIFVPQITLQGVLLREAFFLNKLTMSSFQIIKPKIYFENFGALKQNKTNREFEEFYELIFNYISDFNIKSINIPDGEFTWVNHTRKGKTISFDNGFSANLNNFRLNEAELSKKRLLFSDNFDISLMDQNFLLSDSVHVLHAGEINLSTSNKSIRIKNASLYPDNKSDNYKKLTTTYQIAIPALVFSNIDFSKAYWDKDLFLDQLDIDDAKFRIYSKKGIEKSLDLNKFKVPMPTEIHSVKINELNINNGQVITYETDGNNQEVGATFNIDLQLPGVVLQSDEENRISFTTKKFLSRISNFNTTLGERHNLEINTLVYSREDKNVLVNGLKITPTGPINSGNSFSVKVPNIRFTGFDVNAALEENNFLFNEISVSDPEINIHVIDSIKGDKFEFTKNLDLYPYINPYVNQLEISRLNLENVDLTFNWFQKKLVDRKFNIDFKDILISETNHTENLLHAREFELITTGLQTESKNRMYRFSADSLIYNSARHNVLLKKIGVKPLLSLEDFNKKNTYQTDYVQVSTNQIEITGINEGLWLQNNIIDADALIIGKTDASIFRNRRYPFNINQRPPWPQDLLKSIKQPFVFDSVILKPSNLKYSELTEISNDPGTISFNDLNFKTTSLTNENGLLNKIPVFTVWADARIMNQSLLSATFKFDLSANNYSHTVVGSLQPVSMRSFNPVIEKSAPFSIESGQINRFNFNISLDNNIATGELYFAFNEFKINVLNMDEDELRKSKFATFWANKMMLNSQNPKGKNELQPITINYKHDEQRSIINYWWKSIFTAAKQAIGIKENN